LSACRLHVPGGHDRKVEQIFREIAGVTDGAYCRFNAGAAKQFSELLKAVALFAVGGVAALERRNDAGAVKLLTDVRTMIDRGVARSDSPKLASRVSSDLGLWRPPTIRAFVDHRDNIAFGAV
jgi:hypothetical protein